MFYYIIGLFIMLLGVKICSITPRDDDFSEGNSMKLGIFLILLGYIFVMTYQAIENIEKETNNPPIIQYAI